jgi:hypothetical protein
MGRVMQEMTRSDGTTISLIERESGGPSYYLMIQDISATRTLKVIPRLSYTREPYQGCPLMKSYLGNLS